MKNPKSNYIIDAVRIRRKRRIIRAIIAGASLLVIGFIVFFVYILNLKDDIDESFTNEPVVTPSAYSFASTETEETSSDDPSETHSESTGNTSEDTSSTPDDTTGSGSEDTTEPLSPSGEDTTEGDPSETRIPDDTNETGENTEETTVNLQPDETMHHEPVSFPGKYPLQTVTHAERDQAFASLKQSVKKYIAEHKDARIGFYFINLSTSESFGYNDVAPFVVGSCIHIPLVKMVCDDVRSGQMVMDRILEYSPDEKDSKVNSKVSGFPSGKKFYIHQLLDYALKYGDGVAMNMLIDSMSGIENVLTRLTTVTRGIDYSVVQHYDDYKGIQQAGAYRSSAYDLATYMEDLYWDYISYPEYYQPMIDSLYGCDSNWGVGKFFAPGTTILHRTGSNSDFHSESDVAILLSSEPVIVSVTVEAETSEEAKEIQAALGALVYNFISYCHT